MRNGERKRKREIFPEVKSRDSAGFRHCLPPPFSDFFGNGFIAIIRKSFLLGFPPPVSICLILIAMKLWSSM